MPETRQSVATTSVADMLSKVWPNVLNSDEATLGSETLDAGEVFGIPQEVIDSCGLTVTRRGRHQINIRHVENAISVPSYPKASSEGLLYMIPFNRKEPIIEESIAKEIIDRKMSIVQYTLAMAGKIRSMQPAFLPGKDEKSLQNKFWTATFSCSGIKACQRLDQCLQVPDQLWKDEFDPRHIGRIRREYAASLDTQEVEDQLREQTENCYRAFESLWKKRQLCRVESDVQHMPSECCKDQQMCFLQIQDAYYVGCPQPSIRGVCRHTKYLVDKGCVDITYLEHMVNYGPQQETNRDFCSFWDTTSSKRQYCLFSHSQRCRLKRINCPVTFNIFIPYTPSRLPFLMLSIRGEHPHIPPPPKSIPRDIEEDLQHALSQREDILTLTSRTLYLSPILQSLLEKYNVQHMRSIHPALNCEDKVTAVITRARILRFPEGASILGAQREYYLDQLRPTEEQWIRQIKLIGTTDYIIILCSKAQAEAARSIQALQIDMSFKLVQGKANVVTCTGWDSKHNIRQTFIYAITSVDTVEGYEQIFTLLFQWLGDVGGFTIQWPHINQRLRGGSRIRLPGIQVITMDMDGKQAKGLGRYLSNKYDGLSWWEHLEHILVFCQVHVQRNWRKAFPGAPDERFILELLDAPSRDAYVQRMEALCQRYPNRRSWFQAKINSRWIVAGLVASASKVPSIWRTFAAKHTNLAESGHMEDYVGAGQSKSLISVILRLKRHAGDKAQKLQIRDEVGVDYTWRDRTPRHRKSQAYARQERNHQRQADNRDENQQLPWNPRNPYDISSPSAQHVRRLGSPSVTTSQPSSSVSIAATPPPVPSIPSPTLPITDLGRPDAQHMADSQESSDPFSTPIPIRQPQLRPALQAQNEHIANISREGSNTDNSVIFLGSRHEVEQEREQSLPRASKRELDNSSSSSGLPSIGALVQRWSKRPRIVSHQDRVQALEDQKRQLEEDIKEAQLKREIEELEKIKTSLS